MQKLQGKNIPQIEYTIIHGEVLELRKDRTTQVNMGQGGGLITAYGGYMQIPNISSESISILEFTVDVQQRSHK